MVLAHAGDWLANLAFAAPAIGIIIAVVIAKLRERRARLREDLGAPPRAHQTISHPDEQEPS